MFVCDCVIVCDGSIRTVGPDTLQSPRVVWWYKHSHPWCVVENAEYCSLQLWCPALHCPAPSAPSLQQRANQDLEGLTGAVLGSALDITSHIGKGGPRDCSFNTAFGGASGLSTELLISPHTLNSLPTLAIAPLGSNFKAIKVNLLSPFTMDISRSQRMLRR